MGSCASTSRVSPLEAARRRLTVSFVEKCERKSDGYLEDSAAHRKLLQQLSSQQLLALLADAQARTSRRKFSISTMTDKKLHRISSFTAKTMLSEGDAEAARHMRLGFACRKGLKPEAPNQDSFLICQVEGHYSIYSVFDGHGRNGHDVSNFVKEILPKLLVGREDILRDPMLALSHAFHTTQCLIEQATCMQRIDAHRSGTTATVIVHDQRKRLLHVAHVGDSRCVLGKKASPAGGGLAQWRSVDLTEDHKPDLPTEKARIERHGGQVVFDGSCNYRVYAKGERFPGLNMSRAMGDLRGFHDAGISAEPELSQWTIAGHLSQGLPDGPFINVPAGIHGTPRTSQRTSVSTGRTSTRSDLEDEYRSHSSRTSSSRAASVSSHEIDPVSDRFLLMCSDGVWEFISSAEAVLEVAPFEEHQAMQAAEHLATLARDRWMHFTHGEVVDDITVVLVYLGAPGGP